MARIRVRVRAHDRRLQVNVSGPLTAGDLRRLERACGPALEQRALALDLDARDVSDLDEASRLFLFALTRRGASVAWPD